jgi:hypothetical protein
MGDSGRGNCNDARRANGRTRLENAARLIDRLELWIAELKRSDPAPRRGLIEEIENALAQIRAEIDALIK